MEDPLESDKEKSVSDDEVNMGESDAVVEQNDEDEDKDKSS